MLECRPKESDYVPLLDPRLVPGDDDCGHLDGVVGGSHASYPRLLIKQYAFDAAQGLLGGFGVGAVGAEVLGRR